MLIKFENETEWLAARAKDLTSTQFAALFGLGRYKSRLRLWHEKAGLVEDEFQENDATLWGKRLQVAVGMGICEDQGWEGFDLTGYYYTEPEIRIGSSMDLRVYNTREGSGLLEVKTAEDFSEEQGWTKDRAPIDYEFQLQGQMHLANLNGEAISWGAIGTLGRRQKVRIYRREYDAKLGRMIENEARDFWESIRKNQPPRPDYTVDGPLLDQIKKSIRSGDVCNLSTNNRAVVLMADYMTDEDTLAAAREKIKAIEKKREAIRAEILDVMGKNEVAIIGDFQVRARVQEVEEKVINGYSFRRFDISKRKK